MKHIPFRFCIKVCMEYILTVIRSTHPFCFVRVCMGYIPFLFCKGTLHNGMEHISKQICLGYSLPGQSLACTCAPDPSLLVPHQVQTWSLDVLQICTREITWEREKQTKNNNVESRWFSVPHTDQPHTHAQKHIYYQMIFKLPHLHVTTK